MPDNVLRLLFQTCTGQQAEHIQELPSSGSNRRYFRLQSASRSLMGVVGNNPEENRAFLYLSRHFREKGLPVPEVVAVSEDQMAYLQEDLGTSGLFEAVAPGREKGSYSEEETRLLCQALEELPACSLRAQKAWTGSSACMRPSTRAWWTLTSTTSSTVS